MAHHGYLRFTADLDFWVALDDVNAAKLAATLVEFGFAPEVVSVDLFKQSKNVIRMGVPPTCIEIMMDADGVSFAECFASRETVEIDGIPVNVISLPMLKKNKLATGRHKDLADLENLP
ncbi:hypothetical protein HS125_13660 [bacterium]|nr:hypothetical protein [bacterium]